MSTVRHHPASKWLRAAAALALAWAAAVSGCGGGVGVGGTGAYASGPITGFGSVIVNGIEFDDSSARVEDEDGSLRARDVLRLGMSTEVDSGPIGGSTEVPTAVATRIRFGSELVGPVTAVDVTGRTLTVFGQTVAVGDTTVFDDRFAAGLESITAGTNVEVYGFFDAAGGRFNATRVEPRDGSLSSFKVRGPVAQLDTALRRFTIGARVFSYAAVAPAEVPAGLANGTIVRVRVAPRVQAGPWAVISFGASGHRSPDVDEARLRGPITTFTSSARFSINGQAVDAAAASFPDGTAALGLGASVEAQGPVVGGVLKATVVKVRGGGGSAERFELKGSITRHLPLLKLFVLRDVTVYYGAAGVEYDKGTAADLAVGSDIEVRGVLSPDGTRLFATRIRFRR